MILFIGIITRDNHSYCKAFGIKSELRVFYYGLAVLLLCGAADLVNYLVFKKNAGSFGRYSRIGVLLFILVMMFQFMKWWTKDHKSSFILPCTAYFATVTNTSSVDSGSGAPHDGFNLL